ncbi:PAS domain-containing protein [Cloacibacterium sp. TD35]|uniref:PAS domain-containing protein n=1 Tax=Cloacibacterium sp. TD35 TaxID=2976818 RepID=UPI00237EC1A6|nr:PAS domain-containing protein [Cloacibacterium sp. TD35]WDT69013.1 PAS domain-containing protein [Cloacibacterium sp. TD35]
MKFTSKPLFLKIIFAITIAIILFISSVSFKHIKALHDSNEILEHTYRVLIKIEHVFTKIKNVEIDRRNYLLTHDKKLIHQIEIDKNEIKENLDQLREITLESPYHFQTTKRLESLIDKKLKVVDEILDPKFDLNDNERVTENIYRGKAIMDEISAVIRNLRKSETNLLEARSLKSDQVNKFTPLINLLTFFVTIILLVLAIIKINRDLKNATIINEKLILANETANLAEEIGNYGTWQFNLETKKYTFSENEFRLLDYEPDSLEDNYEGFMNRIHPDDLYYVQGILSEMINHENLAPFTYRIIRNNGDVRYLRSSGKMIKNLQNEKIFLGITSDVTEEIENQKSISEKNKEFEKKNRTLFLANETNKEAEIAGNYGTAQWFVKDNRFIFSDNNYRLFGLDPKDRPEFSALFNQVHPDDKALVDAKLDEMAQSKSFNPYIIRVIRADNQEVKYLSINNKHIKDDNNEEYVLIISLDVTEIFKAQNTILERNKELEKINNEILLSNTALKFGEEIGGYGNWSWNIKENTWYFSDNLYKLLGAKPKSFESNLENYYNYVHPEDLEYFTEVMNKMKEEENLPAFTYRILRPSGEIIYVKGVGTPTYDTSGNKFLAGVVVNITEEVRNNETLQKTFEELKYYNESSKEAEIIGKYGFWKWNVDKTEFEFSDNIFRLFGVEKEKFDTRVDSFIPYVYADDLDFVLDNLKKLQNKEKNAKPYEHRIIKKDTGEIRYIRVSNKPIEDSDEGFYYLMITQDITEEVNKNIETNQKNRELEASNKELQAFNYVASHDLQEPLRKIETFISRLEAKDYQNLTETGQQYFDRIKVAAGRMRLLIKDLLQFSRTNKSEQVFEKADLNDLLENAKHEIAEPIEEKKAVIYAEHLPKMKVIPFQIQQLFINLLGNSIKYSKPNVAPEIKIDYEKASFEKVGNITFSAKRIFHKFTFTDNGIGFSPEYSDRIFELFSRLHNKDEIAGTGIGLAICKKIVDNHKGFIFAEGKPNEGATFTVYLPEV